MHSHAQFNSGDKQRHVLLCRHLALPHLLPIIRKSEARSQWYAGCNLFARDLTVNSQVPQHGWKGCARDRLNVGACSYRSRLAPRNGWLWEPGGLLCDSISQTAHSRGKGKGQLRPTKLQAGVSVTAYDHEIQIDRCILGFDTKTRLIFKVILVLPFNLSSTWHLDS